MIYSDIFPICNLSYTSLLGCFFWEQHWNQFIDYQPLTTNLHGSIHLAAIKHEEEVVQIASGCLPGHVFHFFIEELGGPQSQGCVHHLCPESSTYSYSALSFEIEQQQSTKNTYSPSEVKSIIDNLSSVDHWNVLEISNRN